MLFCGFSLKKPLTHTDTDTSVLDPCSSFLVVFWTQRWMNCEEVEQRDPRRWCVTRGVRWFLRTCWWWFVIRPLCHAQLRCSADGWSADSRCADVMTAWLPMAEGDCGIVREPSGWDVVPVSNTPVCVCVCVWEPGIHVFMGTYFWEETHSLVVMGQFVLVGTCFRSSSQIGVQSKSEKLVCV